MTPVISIQPVEAPYEPNSLDLLMVEILESMIIPEDNPVILDWDNNKKAVVRPTASDLNF